MSRRRRRRRNNNVGKYIIGAFIVVLVVFAGIMIRNAWIKSKTPDAAEKTDTKNTEAVQEKKNEWEKKDGKSYYYGEDGKIVVGRFVIKKDKKIYYTDDKGAVTRVIDGTKPMIALTYDDGPSNYSSDFAKLFDDNNSAATFFEVGSRVKEIPALQSQEQALADSNCELANHTYNHKNIARIPVSEMKSQIGKMNKMIRSFGETADPILFRAPEGGVSQESREKCGVPIILWSVDTMDWKYRNENRVYKQIMTAKDGDVVLMHSLYETSLKASQRAVPELLEKGYQLVTVTDLAEFRGGVKKGEKYFDFPALESAEDQKTEEATTESASEETSEE